MKTPPASPVKAENCSTPIKNKEKYKQKASPEINTVEELLSYLFSPENIQNKDNTDRYSNRLYMRDPNTSRKRSMFNKNDRSIGLKNGYHRYTISTLNTLFSDYEANVPQPRSLFLFNTQAETPLTLLQNEKQLLSVFSLFKQDVTVFNDEEIKEPPKRVDCRFVVVNDTQNKQHMYFSIGDGADGLSHAQTAFGREMEGECVSAGVITFVKSDSKWTIQSLSNKSGHFKTDPEALLNPLGIILTHMNSYLTNNIAITLYSPSSNNKSFTLSVASLREKYEDETPLLPLFVCTKEPEEKCSPQVNSNSSSDVMVIDSTATTGTIRKFFFEEGQNLFSPRRKNNQGAVIQSAQKQDDETPKEMLSPGF